VSDEPLPPPPDAVVVGEFTIHLRPGLNRVWLARISDRDGPLAIYVLKVAMVRSGRPAGGAPER
jgi:hypothetical protein